MGFTDDCYTDGRVPSVSPSVLFSPTDVIVVTDRMSPSVKLDNVVVAQAGPNTHIKLKKILTLPLLSNAQLCFSWTLFYKIIINK